MCFLIFFKILRNSIIKSCSRDLQPKKRKKRKKTKRFFWVLTEAGELCNKWPGFNPLTCTCVRTHMSSCVHRREEETVPGSKMLLYPLTAMCTSSRRMAAAFAVARKLLRNHSKIRNPRSEGSPACAGEKSRFSRKSREKSPLRDGRGWWRAGSERASERFEYPRMGAEEPESPWWCGRVADSD